MKNIKNNGFTLAEVLITLAIIGIVAALTIPSLIQSSNNKQIIVTVKKHQSILNQALARYAEENDCIGDLRLCSIFSETTTTAWNALKPYFMIAKDCGVSSGTDCFPSGVTYKLLSGSDFQAISSTTAGKGVLTDGTILALTDYGGLCTSDYSKDSKAPLNVICGYIIIDTNGHKGPNQIGRDTFLYWITKQGVSPV